MDPETAYVYVIGAADIQAVKIGWARNPTQRLSDMQTGSPVPLALLWMRYHPRAWELESALHRHFGERRLHGEWFDLGPDSLSAVCTACENIVAAERLPAPASVPSSTVAKLRPAEQEARRREVRADLAEIAERAFAGREFIGGLALAKELRSLDKPAYRGWADSSLAALISRSLPVSSVQRRIDGRPVRGYYAADLIGSRSDVVA